MYVRMYMYKNARWMWLTECMYIHSIEILLRFIYFSFTGLDKSVLHPVFHDAVHVAVDTQLISHSLCISPAFSEPDFKSGFK